MNSEQRRELLARTAALRATGITLQEIADKLNDEGFTLGDGSTIKKMNVSGYLHTLKKRSNGSVGVSRAEAIASRNATIEAQIQALKAQQLEGVTDLPMNTQSKCHRKVVLNSGVTCHSTGTKL
jgi:DNA-binding transcriptional MerR regulator